MFEAIEKYLSAEPEPEEGACRRCGAKEGVMPEPSRTMYPRAEGESDPNASILLCRQCAQLHHAYWDECWSEYYAGLL
jgi:hypothetical protein